MGNPSAQPDPLVPGVPTGNPQQRSTQPDPLVTAAIGQFWGSKANQLGSIVKAQGGGRDAVTGGKHLDALRDLLAVVMTRAGCPEDAIYRRGKWITSPGYYRPGKRWDLAVVKDGELYALFELKSQEGPSFGNNANNRSEEALGNAADLNTTVRKGLLRTRPYLGYVYLLEDAPGSSAPTNKNPNFAAPLDPEFIGASYQKRFGILGERMVTEGLYDAAWIVTAPKPATATTPVTWSEPNPTVGWEKFRNWLEMIAWDQ